MANSKLDPFADGLSAGELLSIPDSARLIGAHPNTIRNLVASGKLPAYRIGPRLVRIRRSDLLSILTPYRGGEFGQWSKFL